jgi:hypothetical protein
MAIPTTLPWTDRAADALRALADRPAALFAVLLALNAAAMPYGGFVHDARLYGVQVLNKVEGGAFADDLFFRYGSQDKYSVFSAAAAPLASVLGLDLTFFLLYVVSNALLLLAIQRLVRTAIKDRVVSTIALLGLATTPIAFGGLTIFHVNESFLTPRILANALTLFGLERALRRRYAVGLALIAGGCLFHPLMAVGGLAVVAVGWAWERLPRRVVVGLALAAAAALAIVLAVPPLGFAVFGRMDSEWLARVRIASAYNFPLEWEANDWVRLSVGLLTVAAGAWAMRRRNPRLARVLAALGLTAAGGFAATLIASELGYRLLFQGQPYRLLWVVQTVQAPLLLWLGARWWRFGGEPGRVGVAMLAAVGLAGLDPFILGLPVVVALVLAVAQRGLTELPRRPDWLSRSLAGGLGVGMCGWAAIRCVVLALYWQRLLTTVDGTDAVRSLLAAPGAVGWTLIAVALLTACARTGFQPRFVVAAVAAGLIVQAAAFGVSVNDYYRDHYQRYCRDARFVAEILDRRRAGGPTPSVYWSTGRTDAIWLRLHANSYFTGLQVQGMLFNRDNALEGQRRALVVRRFEIEQLAHDRWVLPPKWVEQMERLCQLRLPEDDDARPEPPTMDDLARLCDEDGVDFAVLPEAFGDLYVATNGNFFVYDCRAVRARLAARAGPASDLRADASPLK